MSTEKANLLNKQKDNTIERLKTEMQVLKDNGKRSEKSIDFLLQKWTEVSQENTKLNENITSLNKTLKERTATSQMCL